MQVQLHCFWLGAAGSSVGVHADYRPVLSCRAESIRRYPGVIHRSVNARLALLPVPGDQVRLDCPEKELGLRLTP
jgi:hypothetical protein